MVSRKPAEKPHLPSVVSGPPAMAWEAGRADLRAGQGRGHCNLGVGRPRSVVVGVVLRAWWGGEWSRDAGPAASLGGGRMQEGQWGRGLAGHVAQPLPSGHLPLRLSVFAGRVLSALRDSSVTSDLIALGPGPHWKPKRKSCSLLASRGSDRAG